MSEPLNISGETYFPITTDPEWTMETVHHLGRALMGLNHYPPQLAKLACYCFMDAGRRQETLGLKTKDFITAVVSVGIYTGFLNSISHRAK